MRSRSNRALCLPPGNRWDPSCAFPVVWLAGFLALMAAPCAHAQLAPTLRPSTAPTAPTDAPSAARSHTLVVTVVEAGQSRPIAGATVTAPFLVPPKAGPHTLPATDQDGVAVLHFSFSYAQLPSLIVSVLHSNYGAREITWTAPPGKLLASLPTNYTVRMPPAITVGGFVRDERGQGIADAQVLLWGSGNQTQSTRPTEPSSLEYSTVSQREPGQVRTDQRGFWSQNNFPADLEFAWLQVIRPGGAGTYFGTATGAGMAPGWNIMEIEALRATNAILALSDGISLRGIVVDESGKPVSGVRLQERRGGTHQTYVFTNQADGSFELTHRTASQILIAAVSPRHAIKSTMVDLDSTKADVRIVLPNLRPVRVRLLSDRDMPVAEAHVQTVEWRNPTQILDWQGVTDAEGRVVWSNAPAERVVVMASGSRYPPHTFRVGPREDEMVVRLATDNEQTIQVRVKAVEEGSSRPILGFVVLRTLQFSQNASEWGKAGADGTFAATLSAKDLQQGRDQSFGLSVRADGYALWTADEEFMLAEGNVDLTATLKKARPPAGVVMRPDGQPAENARVLLNTSENPVYSYTPGDFSSGQAAELQRTGPDGSFRFAAASEQHRLLASHPSGFASLSMDEFQKSGKIALQAWCRIEGVLRSGGKPVARERISLRSPLAWHNLENYRFTYNAVTDKTGRFIFTNVPPGEHLLCRMPRMAGPTTESHRMAFTVNAGETKQIDYTLGGRVITGTVDADHDVDWKLDAQLLVAKQSAAPREPEYPAFGGQAAYRRVRQAYVRSPAVLDFERKRQQFQLAFDADGNFRADDVPPGTYQLRIRVSQPAPAKSRTRYYVDRPQLGALIKEVTVPPGAPGTEVDLGVFPLAVKLPATERTPPISFKAATLDGQPFDLASLRGQPALVVFWANWAPQSAARLAELRSAVANLGSRSNAVFVTINLDEDVAIARRGVQGLDSGWRHTRLDGSERFAVAERLSLDTLPLTLLLDPQGSVVAREVRGKRLASALERLAQNNAGK